MFTFLQIITACFGSFAHGSNDVANAIAPFAAIYGVYSSGAVNKSADVPWWILFFGAMGIVIGLGTYGKKVIETIGASLTKVTPSRGFNIELATSLSVVIASRIGMPVSSTHCQVGSVFFVGMADGVKAVNVKKILRKIGIYVKFIGKASIFNFHELDCYFTIYWVASSNAFCYLQSRNVLDKFLRSYKFTFNKQKFTKFLLVSRSVFI